MCTVYDWYPDAKFVLTKRSSPATWLDSLRRFHLRFVNCTTVEQFARQIEQPRWRFFAHYHYQIIGADGPGQLFDAKHYEAYYDSHNRQVEEYFADKPGSLLVVDISAKDSANRLYDFLELSGVCQAMPHANATRNTVHRI